MSIENHQYVTNADLDKKLEEKPSRYEVRFLILLAVIANQILPTVDVAKAAWQSTLGSLW